MPLFHIIQPEVTVPEPEGAAMRWRPRIAWPPMRWRRRMAAMAYDTTAGPLNYLTVYAPWVQDDNFLLGIRSVADTLGFSQDKLRLRGVR